MKFDNMKVGVMFELMFVRLVGGLLHWVLLNMSGEYLHELGPLVLLTDANQVLHHVLDHCVLLLVPEDAVGSDGLDGTVHLGLVECSCISQHCGQRLDRADVRVRVAAELQRLDQRVTDSFVMQLRAKLCPADLARRPLHQEVPVVACTKTPSIMNLSFVASEPVAKQLAIDRVGLSMHDVQAAELALDDPVHDLVVSPAPDANPLRSRLVLRYITILKGKHIPYRTSTYINVLSGQ